MRRITRFATLALAAALVPAACSKEEISEQPADSVQQEEAPLQKDGALVPGSAIVCFTDEMIERIEADLSAGKLVTKSMEMNNLLDEIGITSMRRLFPDTGAYDQRKRNFGLHKWYVVEYDKAVPRTKAETEFRALEGVEEYEPSRKIKLTDFNDPQLGNQWHYYNPGTGQYKAGADINVKPVWENYTTGSPEVVVAVVDGGIDLEHEDLAGNCLSTGHRNLIYGSSTITPHAHGTHVAGTVAAVNNNGKGVAGIAGGDLAAGRKGVSLMSCQIFQDGAGSGSGADGIIWAADHGAVIAQNSWGYDFDENDDGKLTGDELANALAAKIPGHDKKAIDYFNTYAGCDENGNQLPGSPMKGGVVFFSAGNDNIENAIPANYEGVIAVAAFGARGKKAYYSCYGDWVDIAAPGGDAVDGDQIYSTLPGNRYGLMQGTSMACPHASGVAALVVSYHGGQGFTADMLRERMLKGADPDFFPSDPYIGPRLDALGAITYGSEDMPKQVNNFSTEVRSNSVTFSWKHVTDSKNKPVYGYLLVAGKDRSAVEEVNPKSPDASLKTLNFTPETSAKAGEELSATLSDLDFDSDYYVTVISYSYSRTYSSPGRVSALKTGANNPPVIAFESGKADVRSHQTVRILADISEPDGHDFELSFTSGSSADSFSKQPDGKYVVTIVGSKAAAGTYTASVTATDAYGLSATESLTYVIYPNQAPVKSADIENVYGTSSSYTFELDMDKYFSDPDGEQLTYSFDLDDPDIIYMSQNGNIIYGTFLTWGSSGITVTAKDHLGASVSTTFFAAAKDPSKVVETALSGNTLKITTGEKELPTEIKVASASGAVVYSGTQTTSVFKPGSVNLQKVAPGKYVVIVKYDGKSYNTNILVK